jgi:hypothetical protein
MSVIVVMAMVALVLWMRRRGRKRMADVVRPPDAPVRMRDPMAPRFGRRR